MNISSEQELPRILLESSAQASQEKFAQQRNNTSRERDASGSVKINSLSPSKKSIITISKKMSFQDINKYGDQLYNQYYINDITASNASINKNSD